MIRQFKTWHVFAIIFFIAFMVRVWALGSYPRTFQEDEILSGYVGRYLIANGIDIMGNRWPLLYFDKFGDYYIIGPMYLVGIAVSLFGNHEWVVRLPAALLGALVIMPVYFISFWVFRRLLAAALSTLFVALLPWHIALSRGMAEGVIGITVFLGGLYFLIQSVEHNDRKKLCIGSFLLFLTYWIYHPFRLYTPIIFLPLPFLFCIRKNKAFFYSFVVTVVFFTVLTIYIASTPWGSGRLKQTSIFSDLSGVQMRIQQSIYNTGEDKITEARIFHNKGVGYSREYIRQYLSYFSPEFLFVQPVSESRYDVPDQGLLFYTYLIGLLVAACTIWRGDAKYQCRLLYLFFLIVLAPVPAAFTYYGSPNVHRSALLGVLLVIISAYGWIVLFDTRFKKIMSFVFIVLFAAELLYFAHQYTTQADVYTSLRRNDGFRELALYLKNEHDRYSTVFVPAEGNTALYYLFFSNDFSPKYIGKFGSDAHIERIDNIVFVKNSCATEVLSPERSEKNVLVINRHSCAEPKELEKVTEIKGVSALLGFRLYKR